MRATTDYIFDYTTRLRVALEGERNLWDPEEITQQFNLLDLIDLLTHEIVFLNEAIQRLTPVQPEDPPVT